MIKVFSKDEKIIIGNHHTTIVVYEDDIQIYKNIVLPRNGCHFTRTITDADFKYLCKSFHTFIVNYYIKNLERCNTMLIRILDSCNSTIVCNIELKKDNAQLYKLINSINLRKSFNNDRALLTYLLLNEEAIKRYIIPIINPKFIVYIQEEVFNEINNKSIYR